tara:strand:- start:19 stop:588 length:570 start_codon:yes stop_codon:yes gene_type:complete
MSYYGVRYAKNCCPTELWVKYFTSSKHVKAYALKYGAPEVISIRKTFGTDTDKAREYECSVIKRARLVENDKYLNHTDNIAIPVTNFDRIKNLKNRRSFDDWDEDSKNRLRESSRATMTRTHQEGKIDYKKPEDTTNYKNAALKRWADPKFKDKYIGQKWMFLGTTTRKISKEEWDTHLGLGWSFGRGG